MELTKKTVVLIHGAWMTPLSWDKWKTYFESAGYDVVVPTWPYMDRPIEELRNNPHKEFGRLTFKKIVDHYEKIIRRLPQSPLLIGHSMGGLVTQLLLDRGVGAAGVIVDAAPVGGIIVDPVSLRSALPIFLRWAGWNRPFVLTREAFDKNFANAAPAAQREVDYQKHVVPAPGRIFFQAALGLGTWVSPKNRKQPLLIISGDKDRTTAPALIRKIYKKQKQSLARTEFKSFAGRSHYLLAEPGWEEIADAIIKWADANYHPHLQAYPEVSSMKKSIPAHAGNPLTV